MKRLIIALAVLALIAGVASAKHAIYRPNEVEKQSRAVVWFWFDDVESGTAGWTHGDGTATAVPHFHVDTYLAYSGTYSWWCGTFDYDANGGYGNSWDDRLTCPPADWTGYTYPVVQFAFRNDTEPTYDFTYVQAESSGSYVNLNRGFDGVHPWGVTGFYLGNKDNPAQVRFRFVADGAWSDQDGNDTNGGACHFDEIMIWDYYTGTVLFYDDVESGGLCVPGVPPAAGDYWHIRDIADEAWSPTHHWCNSEVPAENFVPPGVQNWLRTPTVDISSAATCTTYFVIQFFTPNIAGAQDYWTETIVIDGLATQLHGWVGDQCDAGYDEFAHFGGIADDITALLPGNLAYHEWVFYTTEDGCGPDVCNHAGITLDDIGFFGQLEATPVQESTWGRVKSMWRR